MTLSTLLLPARLECSLQRAAHLAHKKPPTLLHVRLPLALALWRETRPASMALLVTWTQAVDDASVSLRARVAFFLVQRALCRSSEHAWPSTNRTTVTAHRHAHVSWQSRNQINRTAQQSAQENKNNCNNKPLESVLDQRLEHCHLTIDLYQMNRSFFAQKTR